MKEQKKSGKPKLEEIKPVNNGAVVLESLRQIIEDIEQNKITAIVVSAAYRPDAENPFGTSRVVSIGDFVMRLGLATHAEHRIKDLWDEQ